MIITKKAASDIETSDSYHPLLEENLSQQAAPSSPWSLSLQAILVILNALLLIVNLGFLVVFISWAFYEKCPNPLGSFRLPPSPAKDIFDQNIEFFELTSKYLGPPTPEVDEAWTSLIENEVDAFGVSDEVFRQVNPSPDTGVRVHTPVDAEGDGPYLATFDVVHKLHCVNLLRISLYRDRYPDYIAFKNSSEEVIRGHQDHCIEQLRQSIQCNGDLGILTYNWLKGEDMPKPNFKTAHSCQNWEKIREWSRQHRVSMGGLYRPKDGPELDKIL